MLRNIEAESTKRTFKGNAGKQFREVGHETSAHFLARFVDRSAKYNLNEQDIIEIMNQPANYMQLDGRKVRLHNGIAIIKNAEDTEYITIEKKATPKKDGDM